MREAVIRTVPAACLALPGARERASTGTADRGWLPDEEALCARYSRMQTGTVSLTVPLARASGGTIHCHPQTLLLRVPAENTWRG